MKNKKNKRLINKVFKISLSMVCIGSIIKVEPVKANELKKNILVHERQNKESEMLLL